MKGVARNRALEGGGRRNYRRVETRRATVDRDHGEFASLLILAASGRGVDAQRCGPLVEAARRALLSRCADPLPSWLSGHEADGSKLKESHLGIVPATFAGQHGDGRIMGLGLALPSRVDQNAARRSLHPVISEGLQLAGQHWAVSRTSTTGRWTWHVCPDLLDGGIGCVQPYFCHRRSLFVLPNLG